MPIPVRDINTPLEPHDPSPSLFPVMSDPTDITADYLTSDALSGLPGIRHGFFTRNGGVSDGIYATLNCGAGSDDDRSSVGHNRQRVADALAGQVDTDMRLISPYQVHGTNVVRVSASPEDLPDADALVTTDAGVALGVLSADCGPVLFADAENRVVAAAHAGWKGAVAGVVPETVAAMESLGAQRDKIHAVLGPCISQASYEVGPEFRQNVVDRDPAFAAFFNIPEGATREHFDLQGFIQAQMDQLGLASATRLQNCTYLEKGRFFSFRRATHNEEDDYGRQISAIVLV